MPDLTVRIAIVELSFLHVVCSSISMRHVQLEIIAEHRYVIKCHQAVGKLKCTALSSRS